MYLEKNWKKNKQFSLGQQKIRPLKHLAQLPVFEKVD